MQSPEPVQFDVLEAELRQILGAPEQIFRDSQFKDVPADLQSVRDIAFSGDSEPTLSPAFPAAVGLAAEVKNACRLDDARIIVLTNGAFLRRPAVIQTLAFLDEHDGEIWAKLDAGTQPHFERVNGKRHTLDEILQNLLATARVRPIVIQSLFMRIDDEPPGQPEIDAYVGRLRWLLDGGAQLKLVQVYTVARRPAHDCVSKLSRSELDAIAEAVRPLDVPVETYA
jgi:wyosine [tRNA(Phe)-imidazoG37] synthetase (radical SAM superfamily)